MDTLNKYFTNFKRGIILLVIYISLGTLNTILGIYTDYNKDLLSSIESIVKLGRTFSMIGMLTIAGYLGYKGILYLNSKFYKTSNISIIDAFLNGFVDMAFVYDKVKEINVVQSIDIDLKARSLLVKTINVNYSIIIRDYSGKIEGKVDYENWYIVSKRRKNFNQVVYKKKVKIMNPYKENGKIIDGLKIKHGLEYVNIVVITSFGKLDMQSDKIVHLYELVEIVDQEMIL